MVAALYDFRASVAKAEIAQRLDTRRTSVRRLLNRYSLQ